MNWSDTKQLTWVEWETLKEYVAAEDRQQRRNRIGGT